MTLPAVRTPSRPNPLKIQFPIGWRGLHGAPAGGGMQAFSRRARPRGGTLLWHLRGFGAPVGPREIQVAVARAVRLTSTRHSLCYATPHP
jgi:hypothetical protein